MKKILFLVLIFFIPRLYAESIDKDTIFQRSVESYQQGDYNKALEGFLKLAETVKSADIYYNIANCYMKTNDLGKGIAFYLSAYRRNSQDADLRHNLEFALGKTKDNFPLYKVDGISDLLNNFIAALNIRRLQIFVIVFLCCFFYVILRSVFITKSFRELFWITLLLMVLLSFVLYKRVKMWNIEQGVVDSSELIVRYGPGENETEAFRLNEGSFFNIHNENKNWLLISIFNGKTGWVQSKEIARVK